MKVFLTGGEVATVLGLCHNKVARLFDAGELRGYKLPGDGVGRPHRRYSVAGVLAFARRHGIETDLLGHPLLAPAAVLVVPHADRAVPAPEGAAVVTSYLAAAHLVGVTCPRAVCLDLNGSGLLSPRRVEEAIDFLAWVDFQAPRPTTALAIPAGDRPWPVRVDITYPAGPVDHAQFVRQALARSPQGPACSPDRKSPASASSDACPSTPSTPGS
jgi:hypothetical protein